jgi:2-dehydro-3-deoxyphosphogluconate aldolase/(4S)-4-hydroxy-2-oxoglutarate aldolase
MTLATIYDQGVIVIVRESSPEAASTAVERIIAAGVRALEVSLVTPDALAVIAHWVRAAPKGVSVGVGTVLTSGDVAQAADAGARFIVSPNCEESVIRATVAAGLVSVPGVATPTEALRALDWGADLVKIFPATTWTPAALRDMLAALPQVPAVPTGGVMLASAGDWIRAGAVAVGIGSALTRADDPAVAGAQLLTSIAAARRP